MRRCRAKQKKKTRGVWKTQLGVRLYLRLRSRKKRKEKKERAEKAPDHGGTILIARRWQRWGDANGGAADAAAICNSAQCPPEQERPPSVAKSWVVRFSKIYALVRLDLLRDIRVSQLVWIMSDLSDGMRRILWEREKKKRLTDSRLVMCSKLRTKSTPRLVAKWLLIIVWLVRINLKLIQIQPHVEAYMGNAYMHWHMRKFINNT